MKKILITGGAGFIGSSLIEFLNNQGIKDITIVNKNWYKRWQNLNGLKYIDLFDSSASNSLEFFPTGSFNFDAIIVMGANSSTTANASEEVYEENYYDTIRFLTGIFSRVKYLKKPIPVIFASSAAVYGAEEENFVERVDDLHPLNFYAFTKLQVDKYIMDNMHHYASSGINIYSLRFFNVYGGKREIYKGPMQSVISKWAASASSEIHLFRSNNPRYKDGEQSRDFVHINDICKVISHIIENGGPIGIYNVGTGNPVSYRALASKVFDAKKVAKNLQRIFYQSLPPELEKQYQYRTCANIEKLRHTLNYKDEFITIDEGIQLAIETYKK